MAYTDSQLKLAFRQLFNAAGFTAEDAEDAAAQVVDNIATNVAATGNVTAGTFVAAATNASVGTALVVGTNITSTAGNVVITAGNLNMTAGNAVLTSGNATLTSGNLLLSSGNATLTSGNATLTSGNLTLTSGNIVHTAGNATHTAGNVVVTTGNVAVTTGSVNVATGNVLVTTGNVLVTTGNVAVTTGHINAGGNLLLTGTNVNAVVGAARIVTVSYSRTLTADGATNTITPAIPANTWVLGVSAFVATEVAGCTSVEFGDGSDADGYGILSTLTAGATKGIGGVLSGTFHAAAKNVVLTATGGAADFSAGVVNVKITYIDNITPAS